MGPVATRVGRAVMGAPHGVGRAVVGRAGPESTTSCVL